MEAFLDGILQAFRDAGFTVTRERGSFRVNGCYFWYYTRPRRVVVDGRGFGITQSKRLTEFIVREIGDRLEQTKREQALRIKQQELRPVAHVLNRHIRAEVVAGHVQFQTDDRDFLTLALMYFYSKGHVGVDQAQLLQTVLSADADTTPLNVYADWLEENGQYEESTRIRDSLQER